MSDQARCNGCGAEILWRYTPAGKLMPLDVETIDQPLSGTYVIVNDQDCRPAEPMLDEPGTEYHMSHFATCSHANQFRNATKKGGGMVK